MNVWRNEWTGIANLTRENQVSRESEHVAGEVTEVTDYIELFPLIKIERVYIMPSPLSLTQGSGTIALQARKRAYLRVLSPGPYCFSWLRCNRSSLFLTIHRRTSPRDQPKQWSPSFTLWGNSPRFSNLIRCDVDIPTTSYRSDRLMNISSNGVLDFEFIRYSCYWKIWFAARECQETPVYLAVSFLAFRENIEVRTTGDQL